MGTNPMVEVFSNRIEFSNAGTPLAAVDRIVNPVPTSCNDNTAGFMHKHGICEERGSGYDRIIDSTGKSGLPAPGMENQDDLFTRTVLFLHIPFDQIAREDKIRTCYMQACPAYVQFRGLANSDIRELFGLSVNEKAKATRTIRTTVEAGLIKVMDPSVIAPKYVCYVPYCRQRRGTVFPNVE